MGEMITTRDPRVQRILDAKQQQREQERQWRKNWAELKWGRGGRGTHRIPFIPIEDRLFSDVLEDDAWKGQRCFIIGGGPSLKDFDFSKLKGELVIGINRAYERVDCTIAFSIDSQYYRWIVKGKLGAEAKEKFDNFKGYKVWLNSAYFIPCPEDIYLFNSIGGGEAFSWSLKNGLAGGCNSGYGALNLAVCLGANPIYLLGFDMKGDGEKQAWWHDGYPVKQPEKVYKKFIERFNNIAPEIKAKGIKVINLNPGSKLKCFDFGRFEEIKQKTITAITPTGDRPLAFLLCQQWMRNQTLQPDQWIIVDDGKIPCEWLGQRPLKSPSMIEYVRREPQANDPKHTLLVNLKAAIPLITGDKIIVIEDDEYYAPDYIKEMAQRLDIHPIAGIGNSRYYHLPIGSYTRCKNAYHASLAQTAFKRPILPILEELINLGMETKWLDCRLWERCGRNARNFVFMDSDENPLYVGIKGLPGRGGIGRGHDPAFYLREKRDDGTKQILKSWIPKDYEIYLDVLNGKLTAENAESYLLEGCHS